MVIGETRTDLQMRGDSTHSTSQDRKGQIITARVHITLAEVSVVALEAVSPKEDLAIKPSLVIMRLTIGKFQFRQISSLCLCLCFSSSANRDRDVFLLKPNDRRFNAAREELNYGGFGGGRYSSNNTLDPSRQRRNRRKASTDIGSVDRFPAYNNTAAKKPFVPNPPNSIPNRMVRIPTSNGYHSDYIGGTTANVNSKPKSRKVPPAPPRLNEAVGPVSGVTKLTGVNNVSSEKYNEFDRPVGRKKKECKTDVEDAYYHNRSSRKYRR